MSFAEKILKWFYSHGRKDLPWQRNPSPYRVWVSEIMLQQTQVSTVIPYYQRFMNRFPTLSKLAAASLDDVYSLWSGLGYYARAKNLHKSAQIIQSKHRGCFPKDYDDVIALPGIGRSTAGAILSISRRERFPILDGNVKRVFCRHFAVNGWPGNATVVEQLWALSEKHTPWNEVNHYTQAIMDLGATICTRSKPKCTLCPIASTCQAKKLNKISEYPATRATQIKPARSTALLLIVQSKNKQILLEKRPENGIWGGLWSLPECAIEENIKSWCRKKLKMTTQKINIWPMFRHTFSHFHLDIHPTLCQVDRLPRQNNLSSLSWYSWQQAQLLGIPAPIKKLLKKMEPIL